ncbi:MAG: glycerophosphodiester phosphodiesterase [Pseudobdellovibrio sp.]
MIWQLQADIRDWLPKLQCHRGYWVKGIKQNTLLSLQEAHALGYAMSEFDARITKDGIVILFHDAYYNNKKISDYSYVELKAQQNVSTFEQLMEWFKDIPVFKLNIEIKNDGVFNLSIEKQICEMVARHSLENRVLISSFNPLSLLKVRVYNNKIRRALLLTYNKERGNTWLIKSRTLNYLALPHMLNLRYQDFLNHKKRFTKLNKRIPVVLWTVNDLNIWRDNKDSIHGVISDEITPGQVNF